MDAARALLEHYWIDKKKDKDLYAKVRHHLPDCQKFFRDLLGWTVLNNEKILKIEKIPAHAEGFMGITEFTEIRDYCILCAVLIFLDDKEDNEQFLLSELVDVLEMQLKDRMEVDWTKFTQRKSLVRVLRFAEHMGFIDVYEGKSEGIGSGGIGQEVLYENTGLSRYFATNFSYSISGFTSWRDFEKEQRKEAKTDRGHYRTNRVYRQLAAAPALYWGRDDDVDSLYLKHQRHWIERNLEEYVGGKLHLHKNAAFLVMEEEDCFGEKHPKEAMLPELVLLFCQGIREKVLSGEWEKKQDDTVEASLDQFREALSQCRSQYRAGWSKEYREMDETKLLNAVLFYMEEWMMVQRAGESVILCPAVGKTVGRYPVDFKEKKVERKKER